MSRVRVISLGLRLMAALPAPLAYLFAAFLGDLAILINGRGRRIAYAHMCHVHSPRTSRLTLWWAVRGCFRTTAFYYADLARTPAMDPHHFLHHELRPQGLEHLTAAVAAGKGVICVSVHYGNPEFVAQCVSALGVHLIAVVEPLQPPTLSHLIRSYRQSLGHEFVDAGVPGTKRVLRHLRAGGMIALLTDRDIQGAGALVPFFGASARIPTGAVELALHTGAALLPFVTHRRGPGRYQATIFPPVTLARTGNRADDVRQNTAALIAMFEPAIRADPAQWFVISQRVWATGALPMSAESASIPNSPRRRT